MLSMPNNSLLTVKYHLHSIYRMNGLSLHLWMYHQIDKHKGELRDEFIRRVEDFYKFARSQHEFMVNHVYQCSSQNTKMPST